MRKFWQKAVAKAMQGGPAFDRAQVARGLGIALDDVMPGETVCSAQEWRTVSRKVLPAQTGFKARVYPATTHEIAGTGQTLVIVGRPKLALLFHISQTGLTEVGGILRDPRLTTFGAALRAMSREAGWAEVGGSIIRKSEDYRSPDYNVITGRTSWVPRAPWYALMQRSPARMPGGRAAVELAVSNAIAGESLTAPQRRTVLWMLAECECPEEEWQEQQRKEQQPIEEPAEEDADTIPF